MKTALITGASSGIGYELAKLFARDGYRLVLVARNREKLDEFAVELRKKFQATVKVLAKDLASPRAPDEIFIELEQESVWIDVLVNNAGFGVHGFFSQTPLEEELEMLQVNVTSLTHLTKLFLRPMVKRGEGGILNVASTAAFQPGPLMAVYYATKAYVLSFSEALAEELRGTGVSVTCFCPGATLTGFQKRAGIEGIRLLKLVDIPDAEMVARAGYRAFKAKKRVFIPGFFNNLFAFGVRWVPRGLVMRLVKSLQDSRIKD